MNTNWLKVLSLIALVLAVGCSARKSREADMRQTIAETGSEPGMKQTALLAALGATIAPLVASIFQPLLTNIATGITAGITNTLTSGFAPVARLDEGLDAYLVESPEEPNGDRTPGSYLVLTPANQKLPDPSSIIPPKSPQNLIHSFPVPILQAFSHGARQPKS